MCQRIEVILKMPPKKVVGVVIDCENGKKDGGGDWSG